MGPLAAGSMRRERALVPNRIIREGILTSKRMEKLGWAEEVFYRRLLSVVDDFGRYYADHGLLHAACYPRQLSKVSDVDIGDWLLSCVAAGLIKVYQAEDGESYLEVIDFGQQVRAKKSKFPDARSTCVADAKQMPANDHLDVSVFGVVSEGVDVSAAAASAPAPSPKKAERKTQMPEDFGVSDRVDAWAKEKGYGHLADHLDAFRRKAKAKAYTYADWDAAFMEAIREDWAKLRGRAFNGVAPPPDVQAPRGPDPALAKIKADSLNATGPTAEQRAALEALKGRRTPIHQPHGVTA